METYSQANDPAFNAAIMGFLTFMMIFALAFSVLMIAAFWKIFRKAGYEGWEAIIPIYNMYVLLKIVGKPGWWLILMLIPIVNIVFAIWTMNMLSKSFGKDEGFTAGLILLGFVFLPILGFGKSQYLGPYGDPQLFEEYQRRKSFDVDGIGRA